MDKQLISVIIPVYNESGNLNELYNRLICELNKFNNFLYEIIFIDDGSKDDSWVILRNLYCSNKNIKGIKLSRNFGHQNALKAGIDLAHGDVVITMDADLQHPPKLIPEMLNCWQQGFDIICAVRLDTNGVSYWKEFNSKFYYKFLNLISGLDLSKGSSDYKLFDKKVINELKKFHENQLFIRGLVNWIGFNSTNITYVADKRFSGNSSYSYKKMLKFAVDGIMSFSTRPLRIASILGIVVSIFAFLNILSALYDNYILRKTVPGWTSILVSVLFLGGIQLLSIGLLGEYIGKMFLETKKRKNYIISSRLDNNEDNN
ncbi:MAG: glycosyltransferase family 2 protein [Ignavibacteriaceae bacterium]